jgi:hypothetical protein
MELARRLGEGDKFNYKNSEETFNELRVASRKRRRLLRNYLRKSRKKSRNFLALSYRRSSRNTETLGRQGFQYQ